MTRGPLLSVLILCLAACGARQPETDGVFAPGIAGEATTDGLLVGHRLMASGNFELALRAYTRAAAQQGLNVDTLSALGSANLRLGRLGQAETLLRRATDEGPEFSPAWNNLGVLLMERRDYGEAAEAFRRGICHGTTEIPTGSGQTCPSRLPNGTVRSLLTTNRTSLIWSSWARETPSTRSEAEAAKDAKHAPPDPDRPCRDTPSVGMRQERRRRSAARLAGSECRG